MLVFVYFVGVVYITLIFDFVGCFVLGGLMLLVEIDGLSRLYEFELVVDGCLVCVDFCFDLITSFVNFTVLRVVVYCSCVYGVDLVCWLTLCFVRWFDGWFDLGLLILLGFVGWLICVFSWFGCLFAYLFLVCILDVYLY